MEKDELWVENVQSFANKIFNSSSESMIEIPNNSIHLVITSPPYNVGKEYEKDLDLDSYRSMLRRVMSEVYRVLIDGGRACINIANIGRKPYLPLHAFIIQDMLDIGFIMRGEIIWNKGAGAGASTAWGSWLSAKNPVLRDVHEYILVFSKNSLERIDYQNKKSTIRSEEFLEYTKSIWHFNPESAKRIGHPAPFPVELPKRLIKLYSYEYDIVLDPFMGSGTTAVAAIQTNRYYVGYEIKSEYIDIANKRMKEVKGCF